MIKERLSKGSKSQQKRKKWGNTWIDELKSQDYFFLDCPFQDDLRKNFSLRPSLWKRVEEGKENLSLSKRFSVKHHSYHPLALATSSLLFSSIFPLFSGDIFHGRTYFILQYLFFSVCLKFFFFFFWVNRKTDTFST